MKNLVIVESPAKAKTIGKYLGPDFIVKSSVGHVRDLPSGGQGRAVASKRKRASSRAPVDPRRKLYERMGIDPTKNWKANYEVVPGREKIVAELKNLVKGVQKIYLATDLDREGECIAWHLRELIGEGEEKKGERRFHRVVFNEITRRAIQDAFQNPADLDMNRVNAQQTRRFLDRIVGFMVSPLLWRKVARRLSAGRVQSVAVRMVVEREREIRKFISEEYWELHADAKTAAGEELRLQVKKHNDGNFRPCSEEAVQEAVSALTGASLQVAAREERAVQVKPYPPFTTSTLQQAASARLGFGVRKTMRMAQSLYEAGHITYMRTDSVSLGRDAVADCRRHIDAEYGSRYLLDKPRAYKSRRDAQEAHEAIRPTDTNTSAQGLPGMERDAQRLYDLIRRQFIACQMPAAQYTAIALTATAAGFELRASGRVLRFDGFTKVLPSLKKKNEEEQALPDVEQGASLQLLKLVPSQHFTRPLPRYTEASLVREMEKRGIGRPSTYAPVISTIQERGYVSRNGRSLHAEKIGDIVTDRLQHNFEDLMDYSFTAGMEEILDQIENGKADWKQTLDEFYRDFLLKIEQAEGEASAGGMRGNTPIATAIACVRCGRNMQARFAASGIFLSCSGYELAEEDGRCRETLNLTPGEESIAQDEDAEEADARHQRELRRCAKCKTAMDVFLVNSSCRLHLCGRAPDCDGHEVETGSFRVKGYDGPSLDCDRCSSPMELRNGRFGKYFACTGEDCGNTRKLLRSGQPAPPKMKPVPMPELRCTGADDYFVLRDGAAGLFLAASSFPRHRESRSVLVEELLPHRDEVDPKYAYLMEAPRQDPQGQPASVHFSRKSRCQYVASAKEDGKSSGWRADYVDGHWQEKSTSSSASKAKGKPVALRKSSAGGASGAQAKKKSVASRKSSAGGASGAQAKKKSVVSRKSSAGGASGAQAKKKSVVSRKSSAGGASGAQAKKKSVAPRKSSAGGAPDGRTQK